MKWPDEAFWRRHPRLLVGAVIVLVLVTAILLQAYDAGGSAVLYEGF